MADTLEIFGTEYTGVTGIIATTPNETDLTYIRPQGTKSISANGTGIDVAEYASVDVAVSSSAPTLQVKTYTVDSAGTATITADSGYDGLSSVSVSVPQASASYIGDTAGFITEAGVRKWQTRARVEVDTFDGGVEGWLAEGTIYGNTVKYNAIGKNTVITPTESSQTIGDINYMMEGEITVNAIPSNYIGSSITQRSSSDLTVSGATVTVPMGYYSAQVSKSVATMTLPTSAASSATSGYTFKATIGRSTAAQYINIPPSYNSTGAYYVISATPNGSVTAPSLISGTTATISTGSGTLTLTKTVSVTPNVTTAGYISSGTAGNSSVSLTANVTINPTPTASGATVTIPAGYYSSQTTKSVTSGSATAPSTISGTAASVSTGTNTLTLTKTVSVTPTVSAGYVSAGTAGNASISLTASVTTKAAATYHPSTTAQSIAASQYLTGAQTIAAVTTTNLTASNILNGVTIKVGDSSDDDCVASVTGNVEFHDVYVRSAAPTSSVGNNGDIYIQEQGVVKWQDKLI